MKFIVIGCGSIGKRHIRNLLALGYKKIFAFDVNKKCLNQVKTYSDSIIVTEDLKIAWQGNPDVAFITTPTARHVSDALDAAKHRCHLFIEKPLSHNVRGLDKLEKEVRKHKLINFVGCNMRFYWAIAKIKHLLEKRSIGPVVSARLEVGQYLPDWRPGQDYRKTYSAQKKLGGGIILEAIHELDYALWLFGQPKTLTARHAKLSSLEIDAEDVAEAIIQFKNGPLVSIHMDSVQRLYSRSCKVIGEEGTLSWDFNEHAVKLYRAKSRKWKIFSEPKGYDLNNMYKDEIKYFINGIKKKQQTFNNIRFAKATLQAALKMKRCSG